MSKVSVTRTTLDRFAAIFMAFVCAISLLAATGWLINRPILASLNPGYIPMPPATVLIFLGLCGAWLIHRVFPGRGGMRILIQACLVGIFAIVLILALRYFTGLGPDLEKLLYPAPPLFGQFSSARMSPLSVLGFLLAIPAFLLLTGGKPGTRTKSASAALSLALFILSGLICLGYLYGALPFYGGTLIPVAITTAITFWFLSLGLLMMAGPSCWPVSTYIGPSLKARLMRTFIPASLLIVLIQGLLSTLDEPWIINPALRVAVAALVATLIVVIVISLIANNLSADIERGKRAEAALRESEEKFREFFNNAEVGMFRTRMDGSEILDMNERFLAIFGRTRTEMLGSASVLHWADPREREEMVRRLEAEGRVIDFECGLLDKQGQVKRCLTSMRLIRAQGILEGSILDITERKQTQILQEAVYRIAAAAETTRSLDELYHQIHQIILSVMPAENFYITLYDEAQNLLRFPYFKDAEDAPFMDGVQPGKGLTAYVLRTGKSLLCTQAVHNELERQGEVKLLGVPSAIWLGVPLIVEGKTIGAMVVQHFSDPKAYSEREQHMLEFVSTQVAIAINRKRAEEALRQSEAELRALFASMHDVVLVIDRLGVYLKIAPTNPELLVKPPDELLGKTLWDVFQPDQVETFITAIKQVLNTKQTVQIEYDLTLGDRIVPFETSISPMTEDSTLWVVRDITERKRMELVQNAIFRITQAALTGEGIDALYHSIHSILGELIPVENFFIALIDPANNLISFPYYVDQYDEPPTAPTQVQGLTGYVLRTGRPLLATREIFDRLVGQGEVEKVGTVSVDWLGAPLKVEGRMIGVMAVQSYTEGIHYDQEDLNLLEFVSTQVAQAIERKRMEEEIRNLSLTDELTGLYNRRGFTLLAEQEVKLAHRKKRSMLFFFTDVDNLKAINDNLGHAQGDLALMDVAAILKEAFREADIPARFGGDEFVVLAVDATLESAEVLTNRIQVTLERRNRQGDRPYQLTLSMGVARYDPEVPCTVSELIAQADGLMYDHKQAGKGKQ